MGGLLDTMGFGGAAEGKSWNFAGNIAKAALIFHIGPMKDANGVETPGGDSVLQVQYNPASVRFQANAQPMPFKYLQNNVESSIPTQRTRNAAIVLSVQLIFDDTNVKDAFMADKFRVSLSDLVSVGTGIYKNVKGNGYSVMPQTNAIIAALMRDSTRNVTFRWADLSFTGELTEAQAAYTMFSVSGKPVRSTVTINITQEIENKAGDAWDKSFDAVFGEKDSAKGAAGASAERWTQNLLNFNL